MKETKQDILLKLPAVAGTILAFSCGWAKGIITDKEASQKVDGAIRELVSIQFKIQELLDGAGKTASGE